MHCCDSETVSAYRAIRSLAHKGPSLDPQEAAALAEEATAAGLQAPEEWLDVALARVDVCRWLGQPAQDATRTAFQAAQALMQVPALDSGLTCCICPSQAHLVVSAGCCKNIRLDTREACLLQANWPDWTDRSLQLPGYWAEWEARSAGDVRAARAVWEAALTGPLGKCALPAHIRTCRWLCNWVLYSSLRLA